MIRRRTGEGLIVTALCVPLGLLNGLIIGNGLLKDAFDNNEPFKV
jgi:hypothetical protein